jgi:hypothetical protein
MACNATTDKGPNGRGPAKAKQVKLGAKVGVIHDPFHPPWSHHARKAYDLSLSRPPEEMERCGALPSEPALTGAGTLH